jgi:hypothetical protein
MTSYVIHTGVMNRAANFAIQNIADYADRDVMSSISNPAFAPITGRAMRTAANELYDEWQNTGRDLRGTWGTAGLPGVRSAFAGVALRCRGKEDAMNNAAFSSERTVPRT